jgi:hypothetical protein
MAQAVNPNFPNNHNHPPVSPRGDHNQGGGRRLPAQAIQSQGQPGKRPTPKSQANKNLFDQVYNPAVGKPEYSKQEAADRRLQMGRHNKGHILNQSGYKQFTSGNDDSSWDQRIEQTDPTPTRHNQFDVV